MAEEQEDSAQKTEEPTGRKLEKAREKGQVVRSQEVSHWFGILAFALVVGFFGVAVAGGLGKVLRPFLERPEAIAADKGRLDGLAWDLVGSVGWVLLLPMLLIFCAGLAAGLLQSGLRFAPEKIKPNLENISPKKGAKKMFSLNGVAELLKDLAKLLIVGSVILAAIYPALDLIKVLGTVEPIAFMQILHDYALRVLIGVLVVMSFVAVADYLFQRHQFMKQMRMTKQEVKDEFKQSEGDPQIKMRLRQIRTERARQRMMAAVPEADVVITNPTHYAVALKYDAETMEAPRLTAKGADLIAQRIRELAEEHKIPVVENPPLARALHAGVELDQQVPPQHYKAVAEVIGYVMRLRKATGGAGAGRRG